MSNTVLEPARFGVLVVDSTHATTIDGITMPDNVRQQEMVFGTVVHVGPDAGRTVSGDLVCYGPYAGKTVVLDGVEFRLLQEGQIEMYVRPNRKQT